MEFYYRALRGIVSAPAAESGDEEAPCRVKVRRELCGDGKGMDGIGILAQHDEGDTQQEMAAGQAILESDGCERVIRGDRGLLCVQRTACKADVCEGMVRVHFQHVAARGLAFLPAVQLEQGIDADADRVGILWLPGRNDVEVFERMRSILLLHGDIGTDEVCARALAETLEAKL